VAPGPLDPSAYTFYGTASRTVVDIVFPAELAPGTTVFVTGYWINARAESSAAATPVSARLAGGGVTVTPMKIAA
jgi:hypothetical protein